MLSSNRALSPTSLLHLAVDRATKLCGAAGLGDRAEEMVRLCERVMTPWGRAPLAAQPEWMSHVVDDGTPFEFSLAFAERSEVRFLFEPQGSTPTLGSNIRAGRSLLASLASDFDLELERFDRIADLFLPRTPNGAFGIWIAVGISKDAAPSFKLYLNPQASGISQAPAVVEEALARLGFDRAWPVVGNVLTRRGALLDELKYFALDLSRSRDARVKVYARHYDSSPEVLAAAASGCTVSSTDNVRRFLAAVSPERIAYDGRGPSTCYAFVSGNPKPDSVTTHFPINGYASDDEVASRRVLAGMAAFGVPTDPFENALRGIATRPLADGIGFISYVSFRQHRGEPRLSVYLPREAYAPGTIESAGAKRRSSGVSERMGQFPGLAIDVHPFASRLNREEDDVVPMLRFAQAVNVAIDGVKDDLLDLVPSIRTERLRELTAVYAESGDRGVLTSQSQWLAKVLEVLLPLRPTSVDVRPLLAGRRFRERLRNYHRSAQANERIGAVFATIMFGNAACAMVNTRMRQRASSTRDASELLPTLSGPLITPWSLAASAGEDAREEIFSGINECSKLAWTFLNDLYTFCY